MTQAPVNRTVPLLAAALLAVDGFHYVFAKALAPILPPTTSAMFVTGTAALIMVGYSASQGKLRLQTLRKHLAFFLAIGSLPALSTALSYAAVSYIDPGTASLLQQSGIIYGVLIGVIWLREKLTRQQILGAVICLAGIAIISFQPGDFLRLGALLILTSTFSYALHAAITKRYGGEIDFIEFFTWRVTTMTCFLFLGALAQGILRTPAEPTGWGLLLLTGVVDVVVSRGLYYATLRRMPVSLFSLLLTLSPVVAIFWSLVIFGIQPTAAQISGGAAVLAGVVVVITSRR